MKDHSLLDKKVWVDSYLNLGPRPLSAFSFVSIFAWCDFFDFEFTMFDDCLCIVTKGEGGSFLYLPPLGKVFSVATIDSVFRHLSKTRSAQGVNRIENIPENLLSVFNAGSYNQYAKPAEYLYHQEDLIALKGNAYKSQRHDCNCFEGRHAEHSFKPYTEGDFDSCLGLYEHWAQHRSYANSDGIYQSMLQENRIVHERLLRFWQPLGLIARVLKVGSQVVGYTLGYPLDENTFCVYAEIADWKFTGAAAYMFRAFCMDQALKGFSRINTMDDFAMPNVARAKQAYHPSELTPSYTVSLKTGTN